jgi:hypothetical protein
VEPNKPSDEVNIAAIERVRCLSCGGAYAKPVRGGTVYANPGCPDCGYVGWVQAETRVITAGLARPRFSSDPPRRRSA